MGPPWPAGIVGSMNRTLFRGQRPVRFKTHSPTVPALLVLVAAVAALAIVRPSRAETFATPPTADDPVARAVEAERARADVPGIAIAIVKDGVPLRVEGFGIANLEHGVPVHADTLFKTGALGMQFTAAGVLRLAEQGRLDLDGSIRAILPELPARWQPVTVRQMLSHTSGLPATPNGDFRVEYTDAQMLDIIAHEDLNFAAGTRWRFGYVDYVVLGQAIRRITGRPYAAYLAQEVFAPAGMTRARGIDELAIIPGRAAGYERRDGQLRNAEWISAAANSTADGSLYLSALDYAAWAGAMSRGAVLSPRSWAQMGEAARLPGGATCGYGLGWYVDGRTWWHGGSWQGFQTFAIRYGAQGLTVAVLANGEGADAETLARQIAALTVPALARPKAEPLPDRATAPGAAMTARVRKVLGAIAENRVEPAAFAHYAALDLKEMVGQYAGVVAPLGRLEALAPFAHTSACGGPAWRYRARFANGIVDVMLATTADDRITDLAITPVAAWDAPL